MSYQSEILHSLIVIIIDSKKRIEKRGGAKEYETHLYYDLRLEFFWLGGSLSVPPLVVLFTNLSSRFLGYLHCYCCFFVFSKLPLILAGSEESGAGNAVYISGHMNWGEGMPFISLVIWIGVREGGCFASEIDQCLDFGSRNRTTTNNGRREK